MSQNKLLMEITQLQIDVANLKKQLAESKIKEQIRNDVWNQFAKKVNGIVGLKEVVTSQNFYLKLIWLFLFTLGIGATIFDMHQIGDEYFAYPTATSVIMQRREKYDYPPISLCPDGWLDVDKAVSMGLSIDAIKYSLGYYNNFDNIILKNDTKSVRDEFLSFYTIRNFSSLLDYYREITQDLIIHQIVPSPINQTPSFYYCAGCSQSRKISKSFVNNGLCYTSYLKSAPHGLGALSNTRRILIVQEDRTRNLIAGSERWGLYVCSQVQLNFPNPQCHSIFVQSSFKTNVQVSVSEFTALSTKTTPCIDLENAHSLDQCSAKCQNRYFLETISCQLFSLSSPSDRNVTDFCNFLDKSIDNRSFLDYFNQLEDTLESKMNGRIRDCVTKCQPSCKRNLYQVALETQFNLNDFNYYNLKNVINRSNVQAIVVQVKHGAIFDGGILIWTEFYTYSLSQFVSNIGGTLGLFVGGTIMTLAQIILFFVYYCVDNNREK